MDLRVGDRHLVRDLNIAVVADTLRRYQPISRVDLADRTHLGRSTVSGIITAMLDRGLVREVGSAESKGGRKAILVELASDARLIAVARLGPRAAALGLCDLSGRLVVRQRRGLPHPLEPGTLLRQVLVWLDELRQEHAGGRPLVCASVAVPGIVYPADGSVVTSYLLEWHGVPVTPALAEGLGVPVLVESEANAFALGKAAAHPAASSLVGVTLGPSIAAGLVLGGRIHHGARNAAGSFAHAVLDPAGPPCPCGRRGCLAAYASDAALAAAAVARLQAGERSLIADLVEGDTAAVTRDAVVAAARDGDRLARGLIDAAGERIGAALAQLCSGLAPEVLVIGGEATEQAGDLLLAPLRRSLLQRLPPWLADLRIEASTQAEVATLTGAAALVVEKVFEPPLHRVTAADRRLSIASWLD